MASLKKTISRICAAAIVAGLLAGPTLVRGNTDFATKLDSPSVPDSVLTRAELVQSIAEFEVLWQRVWRDSEERRASEPDARELLNRRFAYQHCHRGNKELIRFLRSNVQNKLQTGSEKSMVRPDSQYSLIASDLSTFGVCPSWPLINISTYAVDESEWRDAALLEPMRPNVRSARALLINHLDSAHANTPTDGWIIGQIVRFRIDQRDYKGAVATATNCAAQEWWCKALLGFSQAKSGDVRTAENTYAAMRQTMPAAKLCEWSTLQRIMSADDSTSYANMECKNREALHETLWWLADPLYRDPGNERRVAQDTRRVEVTLRAANDQDERYHWDAKSGGDAVQETILRYGWPTYTGWGMAQLDQSHSGYLAGYDKPRVEPYTTFEYSLGRVHLIPSLDVIKHPLDSKATDWTIVGERSTGELSVDWWPREHFNPMRRLIQLHEGQMGMFRRQERILLASAFNLTHQALQVDSLLIDMMMLTTTSATQVDSIAEHAFVGGETAMLQGTIPPSPTILAIEGKGLGTLRVDVRTRFGIVPPPPLSEMKRGEIAVSDPILIKPDGAPNLAVLGDSLIGDMLGSTVLDANHRRVGLYWETYGVTSKDTVHVAVRIESNADVGALRRLGAALNVTSDPRSSVRIEWNEPDAQRATRTLVGPVPVTQRAIGLNLQQLGPGPYIVEVSVERKGTPIARSQRSFTIAQ